MRKMKKYTTFWYRNVKVKRPLGRPRHRWEESHRLIASSRAGCYPQAEPWRTLLQVIRKYGRSQFVVELTGQQKLQILMKYKLIRFAAFLKNIIGPVNKMFVSFCKLT
jgi:hypothetical protein